MQLTARNIYCDLAMASAAVLSPIAAADDADVPWQYDLSLLTFTEVDRVSGIEVYYSSFKKFATDDVLRWKWSVDVLVGSSFNGASPTNETQIFARPSGRSAVRINAGEAAFDNIFQDNRGDIAFSRQMPLANEFTTSFGGGVSYEYDYKAVDANVSLGRYLSNKNTIINAGYSTEFASIDPEGGVPYAFSEPGLPGAIPDRRDYREDKSVHEGLFGLTQVINRRAITQWNYGISLAKGYLTDPYKIVSLIRPDGTTEGHQYENRPDHKRRHSFYHETKYRLDKAILSAGYRYTTDTWGLQSHTLTTAYRWLPKGKHYWEVNVRFYDQDGADFYRHSIPEAETPRYMSADLRLAPFKAYTIGLKYGEVKPNDAGWSVRLEYYHQAGDARPDDAIGIQQNYDLFPALHMVKMQFLYHIR